MDARVKPGHDDDREAKANWRSRSLSPRNVSRWPSRLHDVKGLALATGGV